MEVCRCLDVRYPGYFLRFFLVSISLFVDGLAGRHLFKQNKVHRELFSFSGMEFLSL